MLNFQKSNGIDYCTATWNIIAGCQYTKPCEYCYCNRLAKRWNRDFKKYEFRSQYFNDLDSTKLKAGDKIFVGSSGDMWGDWVPAQHIQLVLNEIKNHPEYTFLFLTKNPKRYAEFDFSKNCCLGFSIDTMERYYNYLNDIKGLSFPNNSYFISFEPMLEEIDANIIKGKHNLKWIIIGANSNAGAEKPPDEWVDKLIDQAWKYNIKVWMKNNYKYHTKIKESIYEI